MTATHRLVQWALVTGLFGSYMPAGAAHSAESPHHTGSSFLDVYSRIGPVKVSLLVLMIVCVVVAVVWAVSIYMNNDAD